MKKLLTCLMCVMMLGLVTGCGDKFDWPDSGISKVLPKPEASESNITIDDEDSFIAHISNVSKDEFKQYVEACKKAGFKIEKESKSNDYSAFNKKGYKLELSYFSTEKFSISLYAPLPIGTLEWPNSGIATLIPIPKSIDGTILNDSANLFSVYIGDTSFEEYKMYVDEFKNRGFNLDYYSSDKIYRAKDNQGNSIDVSYYGFDIVKVYLRISDGSNTNDNPDIKIPDNQTNEQKDGVNEEFKSAMDSYEKFFDEYIGFMDKYSNSSDTSSMITDYTNYMTQYTDTMKKMSEINTDNLSSEELIYYTEVTTRINQKLANSLK